MYLPDPFAEIRVEEAHRILREHPLGMLVTHGASGLDADHLPFELVPDSGALGTLRAHIARANPLCNEVRAGAEVLVVFRGAHGYISPSWYPSKHETHRSVPTWNYEVVHAHGRMRLIDDPKFVGALVARLTRRHEAAETRPWKLADAPRDYLDEMLSRIVGIEIAVTRLTAKRKLSQNRDARDVAGVVEALRERNQNELASAVAHANRMA
jgi:transcriptional regulator